jgi:hypothetical protein
VAWDSIDINPNQLEFGMYYLSLHFIITGAGMMIVSWLVNWSISYDNISYDKEMINFSASVKFVTWLVVSL